MLSCSSFNLFFFYLMAHIHELLKFHGTPKNVFFADLTKNRYDLDSFTPDSYCCVGCCHFLFDNLRLKNHCFTKQRELLSSLSHLSSVSCVCIKWISSSCLHPNYRLIKKTPGLSALVSSCSPWRNICWVHFKCKALCLVTTVTTWTDTGRPLDICYQNKPAGSASIRKLQPLK